MEFRVPKPLHSWREFAGEVGIIVLGILIALGGEQLVEHFRYQTELHEAEQGMVAELRDDDLPQAYMRASLYGCYVDQLDALEAAVAAGDRVATLKLARAYNPVFRTWDEQAWQAALASQVLVPAGSKRMTQWSTAYIAIPALTTTANAESDELPKLRASQSGRGALSAAQQDRLFEIIAILRQTNRGMSGGSLALLRLAGDAGVTLSKAQKAKVLAEGRQAYGACVREPAPERVNTQTQLSIGDDDALRGK